MSPVREAHAGDAVIAVSCCHGPRYVQVHQRAAWRCSRCGSAGTDLGEDGVVVLGPDGALPDPERDGTDGCDPSVLVNTTRQVSMAGAVRG